MKTYYGIDPGWSTFGFAAFNEEGSLVKTLSSCPKMLGLTKFINQKVPTPVEGDVLVMERFVAYENIKTTVNEPILMLIGALQYRVESIGGEVRLFRAIEWKPALCKWLVANRGFKNPSKKFDKVYSKAAAECITQQKVPSDHVADAICLGYLGYLHDQKKKEKEKEKEPTSEQS